MASIASQKASTSSGGTLSVGGYGVDSIVRGAQVDQVTRLRLILPDGTAVSAIAAVRATEGDILFPAEAHAAVATVPGLDLD